MNLSCDTCAGVRAFEQPPCADRHEPTCPEWVCTGCGGALLLDPPVAVLARTRNAADRGRPAGRRRLAA